MSQRKSPDQRANYIKPVYQDMSIAWDGKTRGPELPEGYSWTPITKRWWAMIRKSAQAMSFHDTDWYILMEAARLHNRFWDSQGGLKANELSSLASELRQRLAPYGFTWADRRKYGINIITDEDVQQEAEQVARHSAADYRRKLNGLT